MLRKILIALLFSKLVIASPAHVISETRAFEAAHEHLVKNGFGHGEIKLEQSTEKNFFFLEYFAIDQEPEVCHIGVVIDRATAFINMGEDDPELNFQFSYSDTFIDPTKKLIKTCAD